MQTTFIQFFLTICMFCCGSSLQAAQNIRFALNDIPGIDMLNVLTAIERTRQRGVQIEIRYLQSEGITSQAVIHGQADIGMGTPYALIQKTKAPIRMFFQLNKLRFHPVVNSKYYKSWLDLDNTVIYTHGSGSGTEAIMNMMARKHGIKYKQMRYTPGSGVRARALINGRFHATIVDTERRNLLLNSDKGDFAVLPMPEINASDEALYANQNFLQKHSKEVAVLVQELLHVWRVTNKSPGFISQARQKYKLLPDLKPEQTKQIDKYFSEMVEVGAFPNDGGNASVFKADVDFYVFAGTLKGDVSQLKVEDYWDFRPLKAALKKLDQ